MLGEAGTTAYYTRTPDVTGKVLIRYREPPPAELIKYTLPQRTREYDSGDHGVTEIKIPPAGGTVPAKPPEKDKPLEKPRPKYRLDPGRVLETGGTSVIAARKAPATTFVALHEPFESGTWMVNRFERIQQTADAVGVAVAGKSGSAVNDRILLRLGDDAAEPVTLVGGGESFTFADRAFVRIAADEVRVAGDLRAMKLKVAGRPKLIVNGTPQAVKVAGGVLTFAR
jgi:hypothetical protein